MAKLQYMAALSQFTIGPTDDLEIVVEGLDECMRPLDALISPNYTMFSLSAAVICPGDSGYTAYSSIQHGGALVLVSGYLPAEHITLMDTDAKCTFTRLNRIGYFYSAPRDNDDVD